MQPVGVGVQALAPLRRFGDQWLQSWLSQHESSHGGRYADSEGDSGKQGAEAVVYLASERHFQGRLGALAAWFIVQ